jgi:AcrR family transcriptional regulator
MAHTPDSRPLKSRRETGTITSAISAQDEGPVDDDQGGNRRSRLAAAALKLFSEQAYDSVYIDDIADEAGVAHGLVSYYFGSKRNLYVAVLEQVYSDLEVFTRPQSADGDAAAQIRGVIRRNFEYFRAHPQVVLGLIQASPGDSSVATIRESVHRAGVTAFLQLLGLPPDDASPFLRSALSGCFGFTDQVIVDWLTHDQDVPVDLVVDLCTKTVINTLTATLPRQRCPDLVQRPAGRERSQIDRGEARSVQHVDDHVLRLRVVAGGEQDRARLVSAEVTDPLHRDVADRLQMAIVWPALSRCRPMTRVTLPAPMNPMRIPLLPCELVPVPASAVRHGYSCVASHDVMASLTCLMTSSPVPDAGRP